MTIHHMLGQTVTIKSIPGVFQNTLDELTPGPATILGVDLIKKRLFIRAAGLFKDPTYGWDLNYLQERSPEDAARIVWGSGLQPGADEKLQYIKMSDCEISPQ